jgi:hypothetical protein
LVRAVITSAALLVATGPTSSAPPVEVGAIVLAVRESRVYLEVPPAAALQSGLTITLLFGERAIATAVITRVYESEFAVATLSSGSLAGVANLEGLRVTVDRHPTPPALLRLGYPSSRRVTTAFACRKARLSPTLEALGYRAVSRSNPHRLVRDTSITTGSPWPDTLLVQFFDESADEEIALERGELDVAVFWPGELSKHMRESPRFLDLGMARHSEGVADTAVAGGAADGANPRNAWPIVCAPEIRPVVDALGRAALTDLIVCDTSRQ